MLSILQALPVIIPLLILFLLTVAGALLAAEPIIGALLLTLLAVLVRAGLRASRDQGRSRWVRRLALAWAVGGSLFGLASIPFAFIGQAYEDFARWHVTGGGVKPGMKVDEARALLARRGAVTDLAVDYPKGFKGTRFQVEPKGLASWRFEFPLAELYYLDVAVDKAGRVSEVKPWRD